MTGELPGIQRSLPKERETRSAIFPTVKVVTPTGESILNEVSRISDDEMREFAKEVVN